MGYIIKKKRIFCKLNIIPRNVQKKVKIKIFMLYVYYVENKSKIQHKL